MYRTRQKLGTSLSTTTCSTCETATSWWAWATGWRRPPQPPRTVRSGWRATLATGRTDCPNRPCPPRNWARWNRTCTTPDWETSLDCIRSARNRSRAPALGSSSRPSHFGMCPRTLRSSIHGFRRGSRLRKFRKCYNIFITFTPFSVCKPIYTRSSWKRLTCVLLHKTALKHDDFQ